MAPPKVTVIPKMFAHQVAQGPIVCPVCQQKATIKEIDQHLNQGCTSAYDLEKTTRSTCPSVNKIDLILKL
jgi:hypothetical protein